MYVQATGQWNQCLKKSYAPTKCQPHLTPPIDRHITYFQTGIQLLFACPLAYTYHLEFATVLRSRCDVFSWCNKPKHQTALIKARKWACTGIIKMGWSLTPLKLMNTGQSHISSAVLSNLQWCITGRFFPAN